MPKQTTQTTRIVGAVPRRSSDSSAQSGTFKRVSAKVAAFKQSAKSERAARHSTHRR